MLKENRERDSVAEDSIELLKIVLKTGLLLRITLILQNQSRGKSERKQIVMLPSVWFIWVKKKVN